MFFKAVTPTVASGSAISKRAKARQICRQAAGCIELLEPRRMLAITATNLGQVHHYTEDVGTPITLDNIVVTATDQTETLKATLTLDDPTTGRSEERRVGKECRSRWSPEH